MQSSDTSAKDAVAVDGIPSSYEELKERYLQLLRETEALRNPRGIMRRNEDDRLPSPRVGPGTGGLPSTDEETVEEGVDFDRKGDIDTDIGIMDDLDLSEGEIRIEVTSTEDESAELGEDFNDLGVVHPLLLEPVLRHLAPFITYTDLRSCRSVCVSWYLFMTPAFLKKTKIVAQFNKEKQGGSSNSSGHQGEDLFIISSSDSEDDLTGGRTLANFNAVFPASARVIDGDEDLLCSNRNSQELRRLYWEARKKEDFDLGLDLELENTHLYIPRPPVPETLEVVGSTCPKNWLRSYGRFVKNLQIDFGNFQKRERYGEVEPLFLYNLLKIYCPNVKSLKVMKPNYVTDAEGHNSIIATTSFENIESLELLTYRSDKLQCVKELLLGLSNVRDLSVSMYSIPPESESTVLESINTNGCLPTLKKLKFPMGIKSTSLVFLSGVEFSQLKELVLGRIRQTRWVQNQNQPGALLPFVDPVTLVEFLKNISGTLEYLCVTMNLTHPDEIWLPLTSTDIPIMPVLKRFEYKFVRSEFTESLALLENLPSLTDLELTAESPNDDQIAKKLFPDTPTIINETLTSLKLINFPMDFSSIVKLVRGFPKLTVLHAQLRLASGDSGNQNVRRPLSRYLFKLRKLSSLEELRIKCGVVERDDFSYSVGFCLRYMRALKHFAFHSTKTVPRLSTFAVDMGILKAPNLISVELEDFSIFEEDLPSIESSLKKKLLRTKFVNCVTMRALKDSTIQVHDNIRDIVQEKWSYEVDRFTDFESLSVRRSGSQERVAATSSLSFSSSTSSLEFAIASF